MTYLQKLVLVFCWLFGSDPLPREAPPPPLPPLPPLLPPPPPPPLPPLPLSYLQKFDFCLLQKLVLVLCWLSARLLTKQ